jgi:hypothetical protein
MSSLGIPHPSDDLLLRCSDGELPAAEAEAVRKHLAACWQCRAEMDGFERTITECVRYHRILTEDCMPEPPAPWFDIYRGMKEIDACQQRRRRAARLVEWLRGWAPGPRQWVPATALIVLVLFLVQQFRLAPSVQAAQLLQKAVTAARSRPPAAPRRIQIRTRTHSLTRVIGAVAPAPAAEIEPLFRAAHYNWEDPLSASSFQQWRDGLADKRDEVRTVVDPRDPEQNHYRLRTTTDSGELVEATLKLRQRDLRAVEETLRFRNDEFVEITELPDAVPATPAPAVEMRAAEPPPHALQPVERATGPAEELQVWAALRRADADLGDPVEVTRSGDRILVSGVGVAPGRQQRIREELGALPRVTVQFSEPDLEAAEPAAPVESVGGKTGPAQLALEQRLGGRAAFEQFSNEVLQTSEALMSRAHALRRLAQRFPKALEDELSLPERERLRALREEHAGALLRLAAEMQARVEPALSAGAVPAAVTSGAHSWQDATEELFRDARDSEVLLISLLGGVTGENQPPDLPARVLASLARLKARAESYEKLTSAR